MCQVVSYKRQNGYGEQNLQGNDKMAAEGKPKTTQQPPKLPQTAPTTLLRLKVYLATLGTNGRSQDWTFSQETPLPPQERTRHLTVAGALNRYGLEPNGYGYPKQPLQPYYD